MWHVTIYEYARKARFVAGGGLYGGYIWAKDFEHAKRLAALRNIGETVQGAGNPYMAAGFRDPYELPSDLLKKFLRPRSDAWSSDWFVEHKNMAVTMPAPIMADPATVIKAVHGTTFLCYIASRAGLISSDEALSDNGLVHEVIHFASSLVDRRFGHYPVAEELHHAIESLERKVPGFTSKAMHP